MAIARPIDRRLFFLFNRTHTQLAKAADNFLAHKTNLSAAQAAVLIYLGYHDPCRLSDLAEGTGRNNATITGLVSRMEALGLVTRQSSHMDRRTKTVILTDEGWKSREAVMNEFRDFNSHLIKGLSDAEIEAVLKFLDLAPDNIAGLIHGDGKN